MPFDPAIVSMAMQTSIRKAKMKSTPFVDYSLFLAPLFFSTIIIPVNAPITILKYSQENESF